MHRVVITGVGVVSPVGCTLDEFWSALVEGRSGIAPLTIVPTERLTTRIAAQVIDFDPDAHFPPKQAHLLDRFSQFAVAAGAAVADAQCTISEQLALQTATIIGSGCGGVDNSMKQYLKLYGEGSARLHPLTIPRLMTNAPASTRSQSTWGWKGPAFAVASACASGTHAVKQLHMLRTGRPPSRSRAGPTHA